MNDHSGKKVISIEGINLTLSQPDITKPKWIGQDEILRQVLACWMVISEKDFPLSPRIIGIPGIGKTTLGMVAALPKTTTTLYISMYKRYTSRGFACYTCAS